MPTIKVYSTSNCKYCKIAKEYLDQQNIPYTTVDVGKDLAERQKMVELSEQMGVPVIQINDSHMVGWDLDLFMKLYEEESTEKKEQDGDE